MYLNRDKCEYAYETPELTSQNNDYGKYENNSAFYWGEVYKFIAEDIPIPGMKSDAWCS